MAVELATPPGLVRTPSAANIFDALLGGPFTGPLQVILRRVLSLAQISRIFDEADAASGNDKLLAFAVSLGPLDVLREHKPCGLHQNHLTVTALLKALGTAIASRAYSLAAVLRIQG